MINGKLNFSKIKLKICYYLTIINRLENKNQISNLLDDFSDIKEILNNKTLELLWFLFSNRDVVNSILYDSEEIILINQLSEKIRLVEYFYLSLLIMENLDLINYIYSFSYIASLNNYQRNINDVYLIKKVILSKLIIDLINNYKGSNFYDKEKEENELINIGNENLKLIKNNMNYIKELGLNLDEENIQSMAFDDIYIKIIISLIKKNKFNDYDYVYNIINQLELETINITHHMYSELVNALNKEINLKDYIITKIEDFYNITKVNFYYILLKFILKSCIYIYNISFLSETRKIFINFIKNGLNELLALKINDTKIKERIEYLLKVIPDSEYYFIKYQKYKLNEINNYYKTFFYNTKKEDINKIEKFLLYNKREINLEKYFEDFDIAKKINEREPIINYLFNMRIKNENIQNNEEELNACINMWNNLEKLINDRKVKKIKKDIKLYLLNYFNDKNNKNILLKIFTEDICEYFIQENSHLLNNINNKEIKNEIIIQKEIKQEKSFENSLDNKSSILKEKESTNNISKYKLLFKLKIFYIKYRQYKRQKR